MKKLLISPEIAGAPDNATLVLDSDARRVLRNTWMLLSLCLCTAALAAGASMMLALPHPGLMLSLLGFFGLMFLINKYRNSSAGILLVFALTSFMGYTLGPILNRYLSLPDGAQTVALALGGTAVVFVGMSAWATVSRRDFSFLGGFLFIGMLLAFAASLAAIFLNVPALSLTISAVVVLLMSGMILYETNAIVRGGETNYVMATLSLFVSIFNLFTSLLHLLGFGSND